MKPPSSRIKALITNCVDKTLTAICFSFKMRNQRCLTLLSSLQGSSLHTDKSPVLQDYVARWIWQCAQKFLCVFIYSFIFLPTSKNNWDVNLSFPSFYALFVVDCICMHTTCSDRICTLMKHSQNCHRWVARRGKWYNSSDTPHNCIQIHKTGCSLITNNVWSPKFAYEQHIWIILCIFMKLFIHIFC